MRFGNEKQLYDFVVPHLAQGSRFQPIEVRRKGKNVHILGETHGYREAVDFTHENIVPEMAADPRRWAIVREGEDGIRKDKLENFNDFVPDAFYFHNLAKIMSVPVFDALGDITDARVQADIAAKSRGRTSIDDIRAFYHEKIREEHRGTPTEADKYAMQHMGLGMEEYSRYAQLIGDARVWKRVLPAWNVYAALRFDEWIGKVSRKNILVSCGRSHVPAFEIDVD